MRIWTATVFEDGEHEVTLHGSREEAFDALLSQASDRDPDFKPLGLDCSDDSFDALRDWFADQNIDVFIDEHDYNVR